MASSALLSPRAVSARSPFATEKLSFRGSLQSWTQGLLRPKVPQISHRVLGWREVLMAVPSLTETPPVTGSQAEGSCILVGDIGGTNARLYVWRVSAKGEYNLVFQKWYQTADYKKEGFGAVLEALISEDAVRASPPSSACFAIAGPVKNGVGQMTNLGWTIDGPQIQKHFGWRVAVINDFEAVGYGIPVLEDKDVLVLNDVPAEDKAPMAVLGPGTGLGQAQLMFDESKGSYKVWPSEGSHSDFAPRGEEQIALMKWVTEGLGYCEVEHVACGSGLEKIYSFLAAGDKVSAADPPVMKAPDVSSKGLSNEDNLASDALDIMLSILGAEAGNMSLRNLSRGGVFLAGGIIPKVIERVKSGIVLENFLNQEDHRFHSFFKTIRFSAVLNEEVGLIGARHYATQLLATE